MLDRFMISRGADGNGTFIVFLSEDSDALARGNGYDSISEVDALCRNGYAHTMVSANLILNPTEYIDAETWGDWKEDITSRTPGIDDDEYKDQYNNELGRRIGTWLNDWLVAEETAGRTYTEGQKQGFLDDLIRDADLSGDMIKIEVTDPRTKNFDPTIPDYQNPKDDVTWTAPSANWQGSSLGRDYSGVDEFYENPIGYLVNISDEYADAASLLVNRMYNSMEDLLADVQLAVNSANVVLDERLTELSDWVSSECILTGTPYIFKK